MLKQKFLLGLLFSAAFMLISGQALTQKRYAGSKHSSSHGGRYTSGSGSSHKGGKYKNTSTRNHYGRHKKS